MNESVVAKSGASNTFAFHVLMRHSPLYEIDMPLCQTLKLCSTEETRERSAELIIVKKAVAKKSAIMQYIHISYSAGDDMIW